jgi:hypothetical protein
MSEMVVYDRGSGANRFVESFRQAASNIGEQELADQAEQLQCAVERETARRAQERFAAARQRLIAAVLSWHETPECEALSRDAAMAHSLRFERDLASAAEACGVARERAASGARAMREYYQERPLAQHHSAHQERDEAGRFTEVK